MEVLEDEYIFGLIVGMFNASPGKQYMDEITMMYEHLNKDFDMLSSSLGKLDIFNDQFKDLDDSQFISLTLENFGISQGDDAWEVSNQAITQLLENNIGRANMINIATNFLLTTDEVDLYGNAITTLKNKIEVSKFHSTTQGESSSDLATLQGIVSSVTSDEQTVDDKINILKISKTAEIVDIVLPDGNYTYDAEVSIEVNFNEDIVVNGVDLTLGITIADMLREATFLSKTSDSIVFKYIVEDGYASIPTSLGISANSITLNNTTIEDSARKMINLEFASVVNESAVVTDDKAPSIDVNNVNYDSKSNTFILKGSGFDTILEVGEDTTLGVTERLDFTKLIWDIDGDDAVDESVTTVAFSSSDVTNAKILDDNTLKIVLSNDITLESTLGYGHDSGNNIDAIDILSGFVQDTIGNITTDTSVNNVVVGIDYTLFGTSSDDILYSTVHDDIIYGNDGDDTIYALSGTDVISGGNGDDKFVFAQYDSMITSTNIIDLDKITDLLLNAQYDDTIDLDVIVSTVNSSVNGEANTSTFISDINTLLTVENSGFDTTISSDISASIINITSGDLSSNTYLAVDYDKNDTFSSDDFIIDVTGVILTSFTAECFV